MQYISPDQIIDYIHSKSDLRVTKHLTDIITLFTQHTTPLSVADIANLLKSSVHISTIHRVTQRLYDQKVISSIESDRGSLFELSDTFRHHHHHFTCTHCGTVYDINKCTVENIQQREPIISTIHNHKIELYGICTQCSSR